MDQSWLVDGVGFVAGSLTTAAFLPQVIKTFKSRSTRDISLAMWLLMNVGVAIWIVYGVLTDSLPLVLTNGVTLILAGTVLGLKLRNLTSE